MFPNCHPKRFLSCFSFYPYGMSAIFPYTPAINLLLNLWQIDRWKMFSHFLKIAVSFIINKIMQFYIFIGHLYFFFWEFPNYILDLGCLFFLLICRFLPTLRIHFFLSYIINISSCFFTYFLTLWCCLPYSFYNFHIVRSIKSGSVSGVILSTVSLPSYRNNLYFLLLLFLD